MLNLLKQQHLRNPHFTVIKLCERELILHDKGKGVHEAGLIMRGAAQDLVVHVLSFGGVLGRGRMSE